jgi:hypothetical protein
VQAAKERNKKGRGPSSKFVNLFTGLVVNAHDGHPMHVTLGTGPGRAPQRRLQSYGHLSKLPGTDRTAVVYSDFENAVLAYLKEVKAEDLKKAEGGRADTLGLLQQELEGVRVRQREIGEEISTNGGSKSLFAAVRKLDEREAELVVEIDRLKEEIHSDDPLPNAQGVIEALAEATGDDLHNMRLRLRSLVAELVAEIRVKPENHGGRVWWVAVIKFRNGLCRQVMAGPGMVGGTYSAPLPPDQLGLAVDLWDKEQCNRVRMFAGQSDMLRSIPSVEVGVVPTTVGPASDAFLASLGDRMDRNGVVMVRAKVAQFVELVGADYPVSKIDTATWGRWSKWLSVEVRGGRTQASTARITYGRVREFVRWLQERGAVSGFKMPKFN